MKLQLYFKIAGRIILVCIVAMAGTFVPEHLRDFFGDVHRAIPKDSGAMDELWDWGIRHYWYFWTIVLLFVLTLINLGIGIYNDVTKHYPEL